MEPPQHPPGLCPGAVQLDVPGWYELRDDRGRPYYHNAAAGITQWERPPGGAAPREQQQSTVAAEWRRVRGTAWKLVRTADGRDLWFNPATRVSSWVRPAETEGCRLGRKRVQGDDGDSDESLEGPKRARTEEAVRWEKMPAAKRAEAFAVMLDESGVAPGAPWRVVLPAVVCDHRYHALSSLRERRAAYDQWSRRGQARAAARAAPPQKPASPRGTFEDLLKDLRPSMTFREFQLRYVSDPRFRTVPAHRRRDLFQDRIQELKRPRKGDAGGGAEDKKEREEAAIQARQREYDDESSRMQDRDEAHIRAGVSAQQQASKAFSAALAQYVRSPEAELEAAVQESAGLAAAAEGLTTEQVEGLFGEHCKRLAWARRDRFREALAESAAVSFSDSWSEELAKKLSGQAAIQAMPEDLRAAEFRSWCQVARKQAADAFTEHLTDLSRQLPLYGKSEREAEEAVERHTSYRRLEHAPLLRANILRQFRTTPPSTSAQRKATEG
eukprot:TRINITY_DN39475_c0_g1_i1.p1 TRINITY_DN39475_c0_g1~~TRINITY_DN39475_c0_g1_i1.p1  ORF type:complete len:514 (+),score=160.71 TRINITY_DN39475_c0_g1_i1:47-1543(+)